MMLPMAVPVEARATRAETREPSAISAAMPSTNPSRTMAIVRYDDFEQERDDHDGDERSHSNAAVGERSRSWLQRRRRRRLATLGGGSGATALSAQGA
jgi:hypothetical protein